MQHVLIPIKRAAEILCRSQNYIYALLREKNKEVQLINTGSGRRINLNSLVAFMRDNYFLEKGVITEWSGVEEKGLIEINTGGLKVAFKKSDCVLLPNPKEKMRVHIVIIAPKNDKEDKKCLIASSVFDSKYVESIKS